MVLAVLPYPEIDPVAIHLGPFGVRWYALSYIAGLLIGWWLIVRMLRQRSLWANPPFDGKPPASADDIGDLVVWMAIGVIVGGRLGFDLFYGIIFCGIWTGRDCGNLPWGYLENPLRLVVEWRGWMPQLLGMSFHGALIGVVVTMYLFCRNRKLSLFSTGDLVAATAPIGLFLGRLANFVNGELWGKQTDSPFGMVFCNDTIRQIYGGICPAGESPRFPSQLLEAALEGLLLFAVLQLCIRQFRLHERPGLIIGIFFVGYGCARIFSEFFRDSESMIAGGFSMGMLLSIPMWLAGGFFLWVAVKQPAWAKSVIFRPT